MEMEVDEEQRQDEPATATATGVTTVTISGDGDNMEKEPEDNEPNLEPMQELDADVDVPPVHKLRDEELRHIFGYLDKVDDNWRDLRSIRLVCRRWRDVSNPIIKNSVRWRVGVRKDAYRPEPEEPIAFQHYEQRFMELMTNPNANDVLRNIHLPGVPKDKTVKLVRTMEEQLQIDKFLDTIGPKIIDLKISAYSMDYVNTIFQKLPNLEALEMYNVVTSFSREYHTSKCTAQCPYREVRFPKLTKLVLGKYVEQSYVGSDRQEIGTLHCSVVNNAPCLTHLELHELISIGQILRSLNLANLTTLVLKSDDRRYAVTEEHLNIITNGCVKLKKFTAVTEYLLMPHEAFFNFLNRFAPQLELLDIRRSRGGVYGDAPTLALQPFPNWPAFPVLKTLRLRDWQLYNNFNFVMPSLCTLELELRPCSDILPHLSERQKPGLDNLPNLLLAPPIDPLVTVRSLTIQFRDFESSPVNQQFVHFLAVVFPKVQELKIALSDDDALLALYAGWPNLRRLSIPRNMESRLTDTGVTGLTPEQLAQLTDLKEQPDVQPKAGSPEVKPEAPSSRIVATAAAMRTLPFIGSLEDLHFLQLYNFNWCRTPPTRISVHYGIGLLPSLRTFESEPGLEDAYREMVMKRSHQQK